MKEIQIDLIPPKGLVMAYFRNRLLFSPYEITGDGLSLEEKELFEKEIPYECHFFDETTEYRIVYREAHRDYIHRVLTKEEENKMPEDYLFSEDVLVKKEYVSLSGIPEMLRVISRYRYTENDTLTLKDYRIAVIPKDYMEGNKDD